MLFWVTGVVFWLFGLVAWVLFLLWFCVCCFADLVVWVGSGLGDGVDLAGCEYPLRVGFGGVCFGVLGFGGAAACWVG